MKPALAVVLALGSTICLNYGAFYQKVAVDRLPRIRLKPSISVFWAFVTNKPWLFSTAISIVGGVLYSIAILIAPVSVVQPLVGSGIALLAYLAITRLGEKPGERDLLAIGMIILGVIFVGVSLAQGVPEKVTYSPVVLWSFTGAALALALIIALITSRGTEVRQAAGIGIMVGIMFGCGALFVRLLLVDWSNRFSREGIAVIFHSVFVIPFLILLAVSFTSYQAALQRGMAVIVVPLVAALSIIIPIAGGMWALNETLPSSWALAILRIVGFALILVSAILLSRFEAVEGEPADSPMAPE